MKRQRHFSSDRKGNAKRRRLEIQRVVRSVVEKKGMDTLLTQTGPITDTVNTSANSVVLNLLQAGVGSWNRIGKKVNLKSVRLKGLAVFSMYPDPTTGIILNSSLRMVVVWDTQPSGNAIPAFDTIFGITEQDGNETTDVQDAVKYDNMDRFSVLRDKTWTPESYTMTSTGTTNGGRYVTPFDEYIKLGNKEVVYSGQSNPMTIADVSTGALYVYFRSDISVPTAAWSIDPSSRARLRYTDK